MALLGLAIRLKSAIQGRRRSEIPAIDLIPGEQVIMADGLQVGVQVPPATLSRNDEIRGWAFSEIGQAVRASVQINNFIHPLPINESRIDIARKLDLDPGDCSVGFRFPLSQYIEKKCKNDCQISIHIEHNDETVRLGPYLVKATNEIPKGKLFACLERPVAFEKSSDNINIRGWIVGADPENITGELLVNGQVAMPIHANEERPDVSNRFSEFTDFGDRVGYSLNIPWSSLDSNANQIDIMTRFSSGANEITLGPVPILREDSPVLRHHRGSYKKVWELSSTTIDDAMLSIAGTANNDQYDSSGEVTAQTLIEALHIDSDDRVLEIGCGTGRIAKSLAPNCKEWIGTDISSQMLSYARSNLAANLNVQLVELESCSLDTIEQNAIDKLYCTAVFMHLDEWDRFNFVQEAYRVLRPAGICYFDNLNLLGDIGWGIFNQTAEIDSAQRPASISKLSTPEELVTYAKRAGFIDIKVFPGPHMVAVVGTKPI